MNIAQATANSSGAPTVAQLVKQSGAQQVHFWKILAVSVFSRSHNVNI